MNAQEMIDFCKTAGIEDAERIIRNAPYLAADRKLIAPETLEQFAAFLMFLANQELQKALTETNQYHFAQETYNASAKLHDVYLLSAAGIRPAPQSDLIPKETIMPENSERDAQLEMEGTLLAHKLKWSGNAILAVCQAALTDANFHHEAEIIGEMLKALDEHDQPNFELIVTPNE